MGFCGLRTGEGKGQRQGRDELESLLDETGPVGNGDGHVAAMDEVEWGVERPFTFDVVDFEADVWGHPDCWLVGPYSRVDLGGG